MTWCNVDSTPLHVVAIGSHCAFSAAEAFASQADTESSAVIYDYDPDHVERKYELLSLKVIHRRRRTGFEETKDFPIRVNDLVAGRYQVRATLLPKTWSMSPCCCHGQLLTASC